MTCVPQAKHTSILHSFKENMQKYQILSFIVLLLRSGFLYLLKYLEYNLNLDILRSLLILNLVIN